MTRTYAVLEVSRATFDEIADKLREAGYGHAFDDGGRTIDMHGIGLQAAPNRAMKTAVTSAHAHTATTERAPSRRLRTRDAAAYLGFSESTLEKDRLNGSPLGVPFLKLGPKIVAYDTGDLDKWMAARRRQSTPDPG